VCNGVHSGRKTGEKPGFFANFAVQMKKARKGEKTGITGVIGGLLDLRFLVQNRIRRFNI